MSSPRLTKAYYVERPARTVTMWLVYARTADEAVEHILNNDGQADQVDSRTVGIGRAVAKRAPREDRDA